VSVPPDDFERRVAAGERFFSPRHAGADSEPPTEVDRVVLAHAREAIRHVESPRMYGRPRWATPLALAATLVLALGIVIRFGAWPGPTRTVTEQQSASQELRVESGADTALQSPDASATSSAPTAMTSSLPAATPPMEPPSSRAQNSARAAKMPAPAAADVPSARAEAGLAKTSRDAKEMLGAVMADEAETRDPVAWWHEIERLRAAGDNAAADTEWAALRARYPEFVPPAPTTEPD